MSVAPQRRTPAEASTKGPMQIESHKCSSRAQFEGSLCASSHSRPVATEFRQSRPAQSWNRKAYFEERWGAGGRNATMCELRFRF